MKQRGTLSQLESWFYRPVELRDVGYHECHEKYSYAPARPEKGPKDGHLYFDQRPKPWSVREHPNGRQIYRFFQLQPRQGAVFYFGILLKHKLVNPICGPSDPPLNGYEQCLTVNGKKYGTYQEACEKEVPDLIGADCGKLYFDNIIPISTPRKLRAAFVMLVQHMGWNAVKFDTYREELSRDFKEQKRKNPEDCALADIRRKLEDAGVEVAWLSGVDCSILDSKDDDEEEEQADAARQEFPMCKLRRGIAGRPNTKDQYELCQEALDLLQEQSENKAAECKSRIIQWSAGAGAGKTYLVNSLIGEAWARGHKIIACAATGIAAAEIVTGGTAHKKLKLHFDIEKYANEPLPWAVANQQKKKRAELTAANGILVDEGFMLDNRHMSTLDKNLRKLATMNGDIKNAQIPFAGKVVIVIGDYRQLPPAQKSNENVVRRSFKATKYYSLARKRSLPGMKRLEGDPVFSEFCTKVGVDDAKKTTQGRITLPDYLPRGGSIKDGIEHLFQSQTGSMQDDLFKATAEDKNNIDLDSVNVRKSLVALSQRAYVATLNERCFEINRIILNSTKGEEKILPADNTVDCDGQKLSVGHFTGMS